MAFLMEEFQCPLKVFDAIDDWEFIPDVKSNLRVRECYEIISKKADVIFTVSEYLAAKFQPKTSAALIRHLPNGVNLELFSRPADAPRARRNDRKQRRPVFTYVGVLSNRFDFGIAEAVARGFPQCTLLLVGPIHNSEKSRFKVLKGLPNVEWRGLLHHGLIPHILRESDVLLIPHTLSPLALSMDPLKLYEYLTTGLPIVATDVPPMNKYGHLVYVAKDVESFVEKVSLALHEQETSEGESMWRSRIDEAQNHSWESRVESIIKDILENMPITY